MVAPEEGEIIKCECCGFEEEASINTLWWCLEEVSAESSYGWVYYCSRECLLKDIEAFSQLRCVPVKAKQK